MMTRLSRVLVAALAAFGWCSSARAVAPAEALAGRPDLEVAAGAPVRPLRMIRWTAPPTQAKAAWARFLAEAGPGWQVYWDASTGVPGRIFGVGIPAPGSMASAAVAERFARAVLARHIDLLAPGASPSDFVLAHNDWDGDQRTVGFYQYHQGLRVLEGQLSFRFKQDRLFVLASEALPAVSLHAQSAALTVDAARARQRAASWIADDFVTAVRAADPAAPAILPLVRAGSIEYRRVVTVLVDAPEVPARFAVHLDAATGAPVARRQLVRFATGTVRYNVPERWYGAARSDMPAPHVNLSVNGTTVESGVDGTFSWSGTAAAQVTTVASGRLVNVVNSGGTAAVAQFTVQPGSSAIWNRADSEFDDAQLTAFVHLHKVKAWAKLVAPEITWLDSQVRATVNVNQTCNANSDGNNVNFFRAGTSRTGNLMCANTGRIADVIYHEFGHSIHAHTIIPGVGSDGDGSLGEGQADYVAATITGDSGMGRGFFLDNTPLREIDPPDQDARWPDDIGEIHTTGLIFSGAMWDLRKSLIQQMGASAGVARTDHLFHEALKRAVDIPSTYVEVLAADDDDGNLVNGTPHECAINAAFALHNLVPPGADVGVIVGTPVREGFHVKLPATMSTMCQIADVQSATLTWNLRGGNNTMQVPMTRAGDVLAADIPAQEPGSVVQYKVAVALTNGSSFNFPDNLADPDYEFFVGDVVPLYCTDFEGAAAPAGWTHGVTAGPADPWQWGAPMGARASGDPQQAFSGSKVYGMNLGGPGDDGSYQPDTTSFLKSPVVDTKGYTNVRLQYRRWLTCEQGYYDKASISGNGTKLWGNFADGRNGSRHHLDKEWRFQDVDLSATVQDGKVQVKFELASDQGLEFGGWTIDDFCVVGFLAPGQVPPTCGDGTLDPPEDCDDGNRNDGDGCDHACKREMAQPPPGGGASGMDSGCGCHVGAAPDGGGAGRAAGLLALTLAAAALRRLRRRLRGKAGKHDLPGDGPHRPHHPEST